ncbi:hypothetical protein MESS2_1000024 [Mesorhizobium metallidurans STM 2683]|uniref:Ribbon-helix-helix domain-containing protein n=1 Tax=Mesorhizobium metallidurans STM 2683 TaxID=1297569 RepID=M5EFF3_9HYPH|nr:hypothetical protein MESS2_1000024 [Mesorhizobium metallidurans STM 2683]
MAYPSNDVTRCSRTEQRLFVYSKTSNPSSEAALNRLFPRNGDKTIQLFCGENAEMKTAGQEQRRSTGTGGHRCARFTRDRIPKDTARPTVRSVLPAIRPASSSRPLFGLLDEIAESQGLSTPKFISKLCDEALEINGDIPNFASMLRTSCALYLRGYRPSHDERLKLKRSCVKARGRRWSICTCARTRICSVGRPWIKRNAGQTLSLAGDSAPPVNACLRRTVCNSLDWH